MKRRDARRRLPPLLLVAAAMLTSWGCGPDEPRDPNIVPTPENLEENQEFVSPLTLQQPIYACASTVVVKDFVVGASVEIYVDGALVATDTALWSGGHPIDVGVPFTEGQEVHAVQIVDGQSSAPSNTVTVTSYLEDYPGGLPQPRISRAPLLECGRAIGIADAVPGSLVRAFAENPAAGGGFDPAVQIGQIADFGYMFCTSLEEDARVWLQASLCTETSLPSPVEIVDPEPASIPTPDVDPDPIDGADIVVLWGAGGSPNELLNGATLEITESGSTVGGQPTPGGGQQVFVSPPADDAKTYEATQALCTKSPPGTFTPEPCSSLAAPTIYPPLPGDTKVDLIDYYPGARILVFADGIEIGDSGPATVHLSRPIDPGETITVVQKVGDCISSSAWQARAECDQGRSDCVGEWPAFRQSASREANQPHSSVLADANEVKTLDVRWEWQPAESLPGGFVASPIVYKGKVYIGGTNGRLYALDANTGGQLWMYPPSGADSLESSFTCNPSSFGIASSATIGVIQHGEVEAVIFGAPDRGFGTGFGSGRLFALDVNSGSLIWDSDELARLEGDSSTSGDFNVLHEQIGYSSPLVYGDRVYVGIANHCDNPIQKGKVKAVELATGNTVGSFSFEAAGGGATSPNGRGGGVWNSPAGGHSGGVFFTTGNSRIGAQTAEPSPDHALSLIRVDETSGSLLWKLQPVPYALDCDPDWAAGAILTHTARGEMAMSTMKDGWAYGVDAAASGGGGHVAAQWQFPPTGTYDPTDGSYFHGPPPSGCSTSDHGDIRYLVPGAAWRGTYITMAGGEELTEDADRGFDRLHSLSAGSGAVRWMKDIPGTTNLAPYQLGPPTVTRGIVFVGTEQGRLVALADPAVYPSALSRCSHPGFALSDCVANGYAIVKEPIVLLDKALGRGSMIRNEPVIANDRVFVSTTGGWVLMLEPAGP